MSKIDSTLNRAINFLTSPLCIDNSDTKGNGGFFGFQNITKPLRETDKPFIFYEITGYGINLLLKLNHWYGDSKFIELAKKAGDSILLAQIKNKDSKVNGAIYDRFYPQDDKFFETFHAYPNAVCAGALCELYQQTKDKKYLDSARSIKDWLFQIIVRKNESCIGFREFFDQDHVSEKIFPYESICIPFILLKFKKELEIQEKQKDELFQTIDWARKTQTGDGFFPFFFSTQSGKFNNTAYSHFTIYPLYNLMGFPLSELEELGCKDSFELYLKCAEWMNTVQDENGGFFTYYFQNDHVWHQQSPAVGQALCAFLHIYEKTNEKKFLDSAKKAATWLVTNQIKENKFAGSYYWIYPNKHYSTIQKKIMYAKERISKRFDNSTKVTDLTILLDKIPIWPIQFAIEGLYRFKKNESG